ncbi:LamG-like jellyroll fold domain-containing protein [Kocuria nitroreducens]|uniref:LamG-like jellyroll fold domain-containing protein n=1 Tax=Kocuria nitroreducens TaxID=3058914 RepID=UPI0036D877A2
MSAFRAWGRRSAPVRCLLALLFVLALGSAGIPSSAALEERGDVIRTAPRPNSYDDTVRQDKPAAYWAMSSPGAGTEKDLVGKLHGRYHGKPKRTTLPNGDTAADFDGTRQYLQVRDAAALSAATRGVLTIEAWMRPDTLDFRSQESSGYVHWMGKGEPRNHEYVARMYSARNSEDRPNRISGYAFNPSGGEGPGSYFQQPVRKGDWIHYVLVINANEKGGKYPHGYTKIYRNGKRMDQDDLEHDGTVVVPRRGSAPFRVGTRDLRSFFDGAVGKVAIYTRELPAERIEQHYQVMTGR